MGARMKGVAAMAAAVLAAWFGSASAAVTTAWTYQSGTPLDDRLNACAVDADNGLIYVTGATWGNYSAIQYPPDVNWGRALMDYYDDFLALRLDYDTGALVWAFQDMSGKQDEFATASIEPVSGDLLVAGTTSAQWSCTDEECPYFAESVVMRPDLCAARLAQADGHAVWKWQSGTRGTEIANAASFSLVTGHLVVAGTAASEYARERADSASRDTRAYPYDSDLAYATLTADGDMLGKWQDGSPRGDRFTAVAHAPTGEVFLVGETYGTVAAGASQPSGSALVVVKTDGDGNELWSMQGDGAIDTKVTCAATDGDGNVYVGGYRTLSTTAEDFYVAKLTADGGDMVWEWKDGTAGSDIIKGITVDSLGNIVVAGYTSGSYSGENRGLYDFVVVALTANGTETWAWQDGTEQSDRANAVATSQQGAFVIAGDTYGSYAAQNAGGWDFVAIKLQLAAEQ